GGCFRSIAETLKLDEFEWWGEGPPCEPVLRTEAANRNHLCQGLCRFEPTVELERAHDARLGLFPNAFSCIAARSVQCLESFDGLVKPGAFRAQFDQYFSDVQVFPLLNRALRGCIPLPSPIVGNLYFLFRFQNKTVV